MARRIRDRRGFTLMELMIVVAIMGILAAIAVPTFIMLMNRSKTGESVMNLNNMFKSAAAYFNAERAGRANSGTVSVNCIVGDSGAGDPWPPKNFKQKFTGLSPAFKGIGFAIADYVYYSYEIHSALPNGGCGMAKDSIAYTFTAHGDLDGDSTYSTFELATGTDSTNQLYHSIGFYIDKELD